MSTPVVPGPSQYWPPTPSPAPPSPRPRRKPMLWWILGGLVLLVVVIVGAVAAILIPRIGDTAPVGVASKAPAAISVSGALSLSSSDFTWNDGGTCQGASGHDDVRLGASVVVTDSAGAVIAVGTLATAQAADFQNAGSPSFAGDPDARPTRCELSFVILNVPSGKGFYGIEVSHRGSVKYAEADLARPISLTLG